VHAPRGDNDRIVVCKQIGITDQTSHKWRREYGRLKTDEAKRFTVLEHENARLTGRESGCSRSLASA